MAQNGLAGRERALHDCGGGGTVVVGVKLDSQSRGLLTWVLLKVAQSGDRVVALHVPKIMDRNGKSSLLSLVKAFESVLAVYEGFCNLKEVDLKLKICRGLSVRKILVQEANSYRATKLIVGTARKHHRIRSSTSIAKYCARKLQKNCSVLAVKNGKVVFQREASLEIGSGVKGAGVRCRNRLLSKIQRSLSKISKELNESYAYVEPTTTHDQISYDNSKLDLVNSGSDCANGASKQKCAICSPDSIFPENSSIQSSEDSSGEGDEKNSMAIVPGQKLEAAPSSISLLIKELPELRSSWPFLPQAIVSKQQSSDGPSIGLTSIVQWAMMQLSARHFSRAASSYHNESSCDEDKDEDTSSSLDREGRAIVRVGIESWSAPLDCSAGDMLKELEGLHGKNSTTCRLFELQELKLATMNFNPDNLIGEGGDSRVYRGCLLDGKEVAVKILKSLRDVLEDFVLEIEIITALHHKNIISLLGFCFEGDNFIFIYDLLSRGSLEENLNGNKDILAFGWSERYKVALGVAEALDYLHNISANPVIHRDVKSSNILLSDDFEPQLSDFGLAKWASASSSHVPCAAVAGTFGYLAPEYFMCGKVNDKIDVYAFGIVLLELLSGRKPISNGCPKGEESLVMWARPILNSGKVSEVLDPRLGNNYERDQMERVGLAAALCTRHAARARPQMSLVLKLLKGDAEVTDWARLQVNDSDGFDMPDHEAFQRASLESHLSLALLDVEDDSFSSTEQSVLIEDYLRGRWSHSSGFDKTQCW